ncbi:unnamed protein product [Brassica oleracea]
MPPNFYEIDEKEGSNDDSDGEDHRRFNMESRGFCITDDFKFRIIVLSFHDRFSVLSAHKRLIAQMPAEE